VSLGELVQLSELTWRTPPLLLLWRNKKLNQTVFRIAHIEYIDIHTMTILCNYLINHISYKLSRILIIVTYFDYNHKFPTLTKFPPAFNM